MELENKYLFEALKTESAELNGRIQEIYKAIYTLFGAVLPAILTVFALLIKDAKTPAHLELTAFMLIVIISMASMWGSCLWMEAIGYLQYRYAKFQPRFYLASGQTKEKSIAKYWRAGDTLHWIPSTLLNLGLLAIIFIVWWMHLNGLLSWIAICFAAAATGSFICVHLARHRYLQAIEAL